MPVATARKIEALRDDFRSAAQLADLFRAHELTLQDPAVLVPADLFGLRIV